MNNQVQKTIEEQVNELTEKQKDTIIKVGKIVPTLQLVVAIPLLVLCIIGMNCMVNPPLGFDYSDTDKLFLGVITLWMIMGIWVIGLVVFVKIKWPYYSNKKWRYINKMRKQK